MDNTNPTTPGTNPNPAVDPMTPATPAGDTGTTGGMEMPPASAPTGGDVTPTPETTPAPEAPATEAPVGGEPTPQPGMPGQQQAA